MRRFWIYGVLTQVIGGIVVGVLFVVIPTGVVCASGKPEVDCPNPQQNSPVVTDSNSSIINYGTIKTLIIMYPASTTPPELIEGIMCHQELMCRQGP